MAGLFFLFKAYEIWMLRRAGWLLVIVFLTLDGAAHAWELIFGTRAVTVVAVVNLALVVISVLYLLQPKVRAVFSPEHAGS